MTASRARRAVRAAAVAVALAAAATVTAGCGGGHRQQRPVPEVDAGLAPPALAGGSLKLYENTEKSTVAAFAYAGERSLISDGRIWEVRRDDRLIATLEIATVKPEVDLRRSAVRRSFTGPILTGNVSTVRLAGAEVARSTAADGKEILVWFGSGVFEVFQFKDKDTKAVDLVTEIVKHQRTVRTFVPLVPLPGNR